MLAPIIGLPELSTTVPLKTVSGSSALMAGADFAVAFTLTPANAEQNNAANNKFPSPKDFRFISNVLKVIKLFSQILNPTQLCAFFRISCLNQKLNS
jgi:hypothetical protein